MPALNCRLVLDPDVSLLGFVLAQHHEIGANLDRIAELRLDRPRLQQEAIGGAGREELHRNDLEVAALLNAIWTAWGGVKRCVEQACAPKCNDYDFLF